MIYSIRTLNYLALLCLLGLTNCSLAPVNTYTPQTPAANWVEPLPVHQPHGGKLGDLKNWWQQFNDPLLLQLIEAAQKVSPDIESAKARVVAAQAALAVSNAQLLPSVTGEAGASRSKNGLLFPAGNFANIGAKASWELDVWGKNTADNNQKLAQLSGTNALWHEARVIVAAQTASQYLNYRLCENLSRISKQNAASTLETARLTKLSVNAGFLADERGSQSLAAAAEAASQHKKQLLQCSLIVKSMVALTAMAEPELQVALAKTHALMPMPAGIEVTTIPANLLQQRPDVLNAERNVAAASFEITVNEAQRYPRLSLAGNIGLAYDSTTRSFAFGGRTPQSTGMTWSIGPVAVSLPIFDAGVRAANLVAAKAQYAAAKTSYESVARNAVREVEEALAQLNSNAQRVNDVNQSAAGYRLSLAATKLRYQNDLANLFELEEARRANLQAQTNVYALSNERALAWVALYRAMGGGWSTALNSPLLIFDHELKHTELNTADIKTPDIKTIESDNLEMKPPVR
jgi:NodT family efflux transporter outer membrane factor (OMF) lipoprotein